VPILSSWKTIYRTTYRNKISALVKYTSVALSRLSFLVGKTIQICYRSNIGVSLSRSSFSLHLSSLLQNMLLLTSFE